VNHHICALDQRIKRLWVGQSAGNQLDRTVPDIYIRITPHQQAQPPSSVAQRFDNMAANKTGAAGYCGQRCRHASKAPER